MSREIERKQSGRGEYKKISIQYEGDQCSPSICASSDISVEVADALEYKKRLCSTQMHRCFVRAEKGTDYNGSLGTSRLS